MTERLAIKWADGSFVILPTNDLDQARKERDVADLGENVARHRCSIVRVRFDVLEVVEAQRKD